MRSTIAVLALAFALAAPAFAIEVGEVAPAIEGSKWYTKDGKAPDLKGKVHVIEFWFAG